MIPAVECMLWHYAQGRPKGEVEAAQKVVFTWRMPMPKLIVLYPPPADVIAFERRYQAEHAPMVLKEIPGLKKFFAARVLGTPAGAAPYQRVAELYFDTMKSLQAAIASPRGQATVAHAMEISTGGPPVVLIAEDDKPA